MTHNTINCYNYYCTIYVYNICYYNVPLGECGRSVFFCTFSSSPLGHLIVL